MEAGDKHPSLSNTALQALFDSLGHKNVLVNGRLEQGPVLLKDGDLIEVQHKCFCNSQTSVSHTPARFRLLQAAGAFASTA